MPEYAILTKHITRDFKTIRAVDDLSLEIPKGVVFGFIGPNGAGKTTTIRLLLGLLEPTDGCAEVLGFDTRFQASKARERTGALLEHNGLYERLNALDNLEFYGRVYKIPSAELTSRIKELLSHFDLWDRRKEQVSKWSRGMKQKLSVARVMLHRPSLIFLDEPTAGLDPVAAASLREDLARLVSDDGTTVFLTTHNLSEAEKLCNIVGVINRGKLLSVGHPDELRSTSGTIKAEITGRGFTSQLIELLRLKSEVTGVELKNDRLLIELSGDVSIAPLINLMVSEGAEIEEVQKGKATLEEAFLTLMEEENNVS